MFVLLKPSYITGRYMGRGREGRGEEGTMFVLLKPSYITGRYMGRGREGRGGYHVRPSQAFLHYW